MRSGFITTLLSLLSAGVCALPAAVQTPLRDAPSNRTVSPRLYAELEEASRIVDIAYCVGMTGLGVNKPFQCASRCQDFENFELVTTWNTGPLLSDSCGYIALSHPPSPPRILVAFRGTYSVSNTIADLSTIPQEYIPYPGDDNDDEPPPSSPDGPTPPKCNNCTVHSGFHTSWLHTRDAILLDLSTAVEKYPEYQMTLIGHSLGGAVACLGALDMLARGWDPVVTTFGEPMVGNEALANYINTRFDLSSNATAEDESMKFRRVTHAADPVPLLPPTEWGYSPHAGELFISKPATPPEPSDIHFCSGNADPDCLTGEEASMSAASEIADLAKEIYADKQHALKKWDDAKKKWFEVKDPTWFVPGRYKLWELFFAHRDYFWRLGLCVPGGDGWKWITGQVGDDQVVEKVDL
ncbi:alpha/beta-hydrolase [Aulographum hederae CBS 113979]|uniref:Alpha/beta-hydrolase n=1 Tax=Aulographum hederae CBS 113979 TaxID=1176131 RepID=A0A6G1H3M1_9PEZI|nr:alpha/beta-hydrolase [Aulographum hederae CBS 113979]